MHFHRLEKSYILYRQQSYSERAKLVKYVSHNLFLFTKSSIVVLFLNFGDTRFYERKTAFCLRLNFLKRSAKS